RRRQRGAAVKRGNHLFEPLLAGGDGGDVRAGGAQAGGDDEIRTLGNIARHVTTGALASLGRETGGGPRGVLILGRVRHSAFGQGGESLHVTRQADAGALRLGRKGGAVQTDPIQDESIQEHLRGRRRRRKAVGDEPEWVGRERRADERSIAVAVARRGTV